MKIQFANGLIFDCTDIDDGIKQCIKSGNDPFNPSILAITEQENIEISADQDEN